MNKKVGIERCESYNPDEVYKALKKTVELSGDLDVAGKTVLLKPNILFDAPPDKAITTHPVFLEAAIRLTRDMGASKILIGDSPGIQVPGFSAKGCGLGATARKNGAEWVDFTSGKTELHCPKGKVLKKFALAKAVKEADVIISLPKLKTHQLMYFTGAMKNIFGLIPSLAKSSYHARFPSHDSFASMLVDLNLAVNPAYAFMDAVVGMEGPGPGSGIPRQIGLVLASSNLLAMDIAASAIIGYQSLQIPVNREALSRSHWLSSPDEIEYPGLSPETLRIPNFLKIPFKKSRSQLFDFVMPRPLRQFRNSIAPGPEINHSLCVRCGDCLRICGSQAMNLGGPGREHKVIVDFHRCIRCFCCHEICQKKAIDISKGKPQNR